MPRVEHESRVGIIDALQELRGELRFLKVQSRPPEIFKEEFTAPRYLTGNRIDELDGRANDFLIRGRKRARIHLRCAVMCNVEDEILRLTFCRPPQILPPALHPVGNIQRAVITTDIVLTAELRHESRTIPTPKINPRRPKQEVYALDVRGRKQCAIPWRTEHELDAVKPQFLQDGRKSISISITVKDMRHVAVRIREIG